MKIRFLSALLLAALCALLVFAPTRGNALAKYGITINGTYTDTSTPTYMAAQQLNLGVHYPAVAFPINPQLPNITTTTYQWDIHYCIKSYVTGQLGYTVKLTTADLQQSNVTCYPLVLGGITPGVTTVTVTQTNPQWPGPVINNYTASYNIYKPSGISLSPVMGYTYYTNTDGYAKIWIGDDFNAGITINTTGIPLNHPGTFDWCQLLNSYHTSTFGVTTRIVPANDGPYLDGRFTYNLPNVPFNDVPTVSAYHFPYLPPAALSINIDATPYLIWNCDLPGAIWVPIAKLDWKAGADESFGALSSVTQPTASNIDNDVLDEPIWNDTLVIE